MTNDCVLIEDKDLHRIKVLEYPTRARTVFDGVVS
jgi:hypothetical protein